MDILPPETSKTNPMKDFYFTFSISANGDRSIVPLALMSTVRALNPSYILSKIMRHLTMFK